MKHIVEHGIPGGVRGCNTVEDLQRYLDSDPHPGYRLASCQGAGSILLVWEEITDWGNDKTIADNSRKIKILLETCKKAYRKHSLDDESVKWGELTEELSGTLSELMGDKDFNNWVDSIIQWREKTV